MAKQTMDAIREAELNAEHSLRAAQVSANESVVDSQARAEQMIAEAQRRAQAFQVSGGTEQFQGDHFSSSSGI